MLPAVLKVLIGEGIEHEYGRKCHLYADEEVLHRECHLFFLPPQHTVALYLFIFCGSFTTKTVKYFLSSNQYLLYNLINSDNSLQKHYIYIHIIFSTSTKLYETPPWIAQLCQNATKTTPFTAMS